MKVMKYQKGDIFKMTVQEAQLDEVKALKESDFTAIKAFSIKDNAGEVLGVFGFEVRKKREAECFALLSKNFGRGMFFAVKLWRSMLISGIKFYRLKRVFITVKCNFKAGERLAFLLGFKKGALLNAYFNGIDYQLFERN